ncbi:MAG: hypothetical protein EOO47_00195 [Flavobacterium sp.]|nr:MAG: hypothetical protein EOO47_00195 [Flavobacterium sp.]
MKVKFLLLITIFTICSSFNYEETIQNQIAKSQNLNISFLLDLSDRINPRKYPSTNMQYYQRDVEYINSIKRAFINHVKQKKIVQLKDQMQVFFDPAPQNPLINKLSQQLKISFDRNTSKENIKKVDKIFSEVPLKIYQSAIKDNKYIGSDIWRFFKNRVQDYCIKDSRRNILVIITDGYMYHEDSKLIDKNKTSYLTPSLIKSKKLTTGNYKEIIDKGRLGFIPATTGLQNLEILVLGINPSKSNPYEGEVINQYWLDWFKAMGVKKAYLKFADLPADLDPVIQKIIIGK